MSAAAASASRRGLVPLSRYLHKHADVATWTVRDKRGEKGIDFELVMRDANGAEISAHSMSCIVADYYSITIGDQDYHLEFFM